MNEKEYKEALTRIDELMDTEDTEELISLVVLVEEYEEEHYPMYANKGILIVGMHKSGTSAMAGALYHCDVAFGQYVSVGGAPNKNSYTLFENSIFIKLNNNILASMKCTAFDLRVFPTLKKIIEDDKSNYVKILQRWFQYESFHKKEVFCIKDPRTSLTLPYYIKALKKMNTEPLVIFMSRPCEEVVKSTENKIFGEVKELCQCYKQRISETLNEFQPKSVLIDFQEFIDDPIKILERIEKHFELDLNLSENKEKVLGFVDKDRKHH